MATCPNCGYDLNLAGLSPRQIEVLRHIAQGEETRDIALALGLSPNTVKNHVTAITHHLGVKNRTQAAVLAVRQGLVEA